MARATTPPLRTVPEQKAGDAGGCGREEQWRVHRAALQSGAEGDNSQTAIMDRFEAGEVIVEDGGIRQDLPGRTFYVEGAASKTVV